jgi:hypothetical protein
VGDPQVQKLFFFFFFKLFLFFFGTMSHFDWPITPEQNKKKTLQASSLSRSFYLEVKNLPFGAPM